MAQQETTRRAAIAALAGSVALAGIIRHHPRGGGSPRGSRSLFLEPRYSPTAPSVGRIQALRRQSTIPPAR
jgi:hypothetical protein